VEFWRRERCEGAPSFDHSGERIATRLANRIKDLGYDVTVTRAWWKASADVEPVATAARTLAAGNGLDQDRTDDAAGAGLPAARRTRYIAGTRLRNLGTKCEQRSPGRETEAPTAHVASSFMRMSVGSRSMFVSEFAMFVSRSCVLLGFVVLADGVMVLGLMMMMRSGMMVSGCQVMMLTRRMLR
jgi:hypothetical protein